MNGVYSGPKGGPIAIIHNKKKKKKVGKYYKYQSCFVILYKYTIRKYAIRMRLIAQQYLLIY